MFCHFNQKCLRCKALIVLLFCVLILAGFKDNYLLHIQNIPLLHFSVVAGFQDGCMAQIFMLNAKHSTIPIPPMYQYQIRASE